MHKESFQEGERFHYGCKKIIGGWGRNSHDATGELNGTKIILHSEGSFNLMKKSLKNYSLMKCYIYNRKKWKMLQTLYKICPTQKQRVFQENNTKDCSCPHHGKWSPIQKGWNYEWCKGIHGLLQSGHLGNFETQKNIDIKMRQENIKKT